MGATSVTTQQAMALRGQRVSFTGALASMSRKQAHELVRKHGGRPTESLTSTTTLLVVGMDGWPLLPDGQLSGKLQKAEELKTNGARLRIISEETFLETVGEGEPASRSSKSMPGEQVCDLVGIDIATVHRWELLGLIRSHDGLFDFQDLVSLKTIASLVAQGATPRVIGQSVRSLARVLPGTDRPLAQLKLLTASGSLAAEINGALVSPSGQLLIRFDDDLVDGETAPALPMTARLEISDQSAQEWFDRACEHEEANELDQAIAAYRRALEKQPLYSEAHFNLANVLAAMGKRQAAEERFRVAIEQNPNMVEAWYNLADLLDDDGRVVEAIDCLRTAVRIDPKYADAHYNLGFFCEKCGYEDEARNHWAEYIRLQPVGEWTVFAKRRLSN